MSVTIYVLSVRAEIIYAESPRHVNCCFELGVGMLLPIYKYAMF